MRRFFLSTAVLLLVSSTAFAGPLGIFGNKRGSSNSCATGQCANPQQSSSSFTQQSFTQQRSFTQGYDGHTHTDSQGHTWGGVAHEHNCPECGEFQDRQDAYPRPINVGLGRTTTRTVVSKPSTFVVPEGFELVPKGTVQKKGSGSPEETLTREQMPKKLTINGVDYFRH